MTSKRVTLPMPPHLGQLEKTTWLRLTARLEEKGLTTLADGTRLESLCRAYADYQKAIELVKIRIEEYELENQAGTAVKPFAEIAMAVDARRRLLDVMSDFFRKPSIKEKINNENVVEDDPLREFLDTD